MTNLSFDRVDQLITNMKKIIIGLDNTSNVILYSPELKLVQGKFSFNVLPESIVTREFTGDLSLPNLNINVIMLYNLGKNELYHNVSQKFMKKASDILNAIYDKKNNIEGVSTVTVNTQFNNDNADLERMLAVTLQCEYKIFATR